MFAKSMYGVVIWANADQHKAIIWCEDQGDLAYYTKDCASALDGMSLDPGDLIHFDMRLERSLRMVDNPQRVESASHVGLASSLTETSTQPAQTQTTRNTASENIVAFPSRARSSGELMPA